jgi:hypothetical protein
VKRKGLVCSGVVLVFCLLLARTAEAQQASPLERRTGKFVFGAGLGLQGGTADGTAFAVALSGDYFLTHEISIGPLLQIGLTDDLTQVGFTAQVKYTLDLPQVPELKPHFQAGIGFIHAELDRGRDEDVDDTSFLFPIGLGAEYRLNRKVSLDSTLLFNFTNLRDVRNDDFFITWLVGIKIHF